MASIDVCLIKANGIKDVEIVGAWCNCRIGS